MRAVAHDPIGAIDLGWAALGPTPVALLVTVVVVAVVGGLVVGALTLLVPRVVDRRWPADEPLDPNELVWGEFGGHVQRTFGGIDVDLARDLAGRIEEVEVADGEVVAQQGEPVTHHLTITEGQVQLVETVGGVETVVRQLEAGTQVGHEAILARTPWPVAVVAVGPGKVVRLPAEDYVAGATLAALGDSEPESVGRG